MNWILEAFASMVDSIIVMDWDFLWLVENAKEGWTKGTTYKVSEGAFGEGGWAVQGRKVERLWMIGIFLWLVENAKEGRTKGTAYKESDVWAHLVLCRNVE
jgi:hypothetical protein